VITIVEAVNSHVEFQENILEMESKNLNLRWKPFPVKEKTRRIKEYEEADFILLPSEFVKRSFIAKGFPEKKLLRCRMGLIKHHTTTMAVQKTTWAKPVILFCMLEVYLCEKVFDI
jgi:hypothetical protein